MFLQKNKGSLSQQWREYNGGLQNRKTGFMLCLNNGMHGLAISSKLSNGQIEHGEKWRIYHKKKF